MRGGDGVCSGRVGVGEGGAGFDGGDDALDHVEDGLVARAPRQVDQVVVGVVALGAWPLVDAEAAGVQGARRAVEELVEDVAVARDQDLVEGVRVQRTPVVSDAA